MKKFMQATPSFPRLLMLLLAVLILPACNSGTSDPVEPDTPEPDQEGILYNVAGVAGESGNGGDGDQAALAYLSFPQDVAVNSRSEVLIVDGKNHCHQDGTV